MTRADAGTDESDSHDPGSRADALRAPLRIAAPAALHPLRLYERWEAATALMFAQSATLVVPHRLLGAMPELLRWRGNPAGILPTGAKLHPDSLAVVDDERALTFRELDGNTNALAAHWRAAGLGSDSTIGLLYRNRAALLETLIAAQKLGSDVVLLNSGFAAPQVADVVAAEGIDMLVHDSDLAAAADAVAPSRRLPPDAVGAAIRTGDRRPAAPPARPGRMVVLTSGTTGRPRGAVRGGGGNPLDIASLLTVIPIMSGDTAVVPAPLFHGLGLFMASLSLALGSTVVLRPRFDPEETLALVQAHRARLLVGVPAMLQRILALPPRQLRQYDVSSLRIVVSGGAPLPGALAHRVMQWCGEVLYNVYGSTEVALATVAGPRDLRAAGGTAGRVVPGVSVRIVDGEGESVPTGVTGRVLVGSRLRFEGYTGGGSKPVLDGLLATGDLGHLDRWGRLYIDGREDEMIVSGGENVFPAEVEDVLASHPGIEEVAIIGVPDDDFGQRLRAYVVRRGDARLDEEAVREYVRERLARFKVPRDVIFVVRLPRNATGKVLKRELDSGPAPTDSTSREDVMRA